MFNKNKITSSNACATYIGDVFWAARIMVITLFRGVEPTDKALLCLRAVFIMIPEIYYCDFIDQKT